MRKILLKLLLFAIFLATPIIGLAATTYYVSPTGSDSNPGTLASPWKTLTKAVSSVSSGDTVYLRAGTWNERLDISNKSYTSRTTFARYPGDPVGSVILNGANIQPFQWEDGVIWVYKSKNVRIDGLKAINAKKTGIAVWGPSGSGHNLEVLNCITDTTGQAGIETWYVNGATIQYNTIYNSNMPAGQEEILSIPQSTNIDVSYNTLYAGNRTWMATGGEGLAAKAGSSYIYFHHNTIDMARPDGAESDRYAVAVDAWAQETHHIYFYKNIIKNGAWGLQYNSEEGGHLHHIYGWDNIITHCGHSTRMHGGGLGMANYGVNPGQCDNLYWWNNTVYDCYYGAHFTNPRIVSPIEVRNNIFANSAMQAVRIESGVPSGAITQDHNITSGDPKFVNASGGNFRLQSGSPAVDAGIAVPEVTDDFDGFVRPQGTGYDIGAHEYNGTNPPLSASASANPASGQAPLTVNFSGSASGGTSPYTYSWAFGDGGTSTSQSLSHTYTSAAIYTATLTVKDSASATASKSVTITVTVATSPLTASASAFPISGQAPLAVSFTGSGSGGVTPYTYSWTFGDGGTSTSQNPSHTYATAGTYTATLTVKGSASATATKSVTITVTSAPSQLVATASADPTAGPPPLGVSFTGSASGGTAPYTYSWNFGDGTTSTSQNPGHVYSSTGNYTGTLTVKDSASATATSIVNISVTSDTTATLSVSKETGSPAPGDGGTTNPAPGNHSYSIGSSIKVISIPNTDYRFSKWGGDVPDVSMFSTESTFTLSSSKSVLATFCTKCADVNGDLKITPGDAQMTFDIYLGKIPNPTWCELENADVNGSGTKLQPKVTPADAQGIFNKYLKKNFNPTCSGNDRSGTSIQQIEMFNFGPFTIDSSFLTSEGDILIPIIVESPREIGAFGFDLSYPSDNWTFVGLEPTDLTAGCDQLAGNVVFSETSGPNHQFLRVGGYKTSVGNNASVGVLVLLVFRTRTGFTDPSEISIIGAYDDLKNAMIYAGTSVTLTDPGRQAERRLPADRRKGKDKGH